VYVDRLDIQGRLNSRKATCSAAVFTRLPNVPKASSLAAFRLPCVFVSRAQETSKSKKNGTRLLDAQSASGRGTKISATTTKLRTGKLQHDIRESMRQLATGRELLTQRESEEVRMQRDIIPGTRPTQLSRSVMYSQWQTRARS
jgi:hypothetical protein